jgi:hypothetical protein
VKVIIQWEQGIGLKLAEHAAQLLFDPVNSMEKVAAIDTQLARAQLPVCSQQKVIPEQLVLVLG